MRSKTAADGMMVTTSATTAAPATDDTSLRSLGAAICVRVCVSMCFACFTLGIYR